MNIIDSIESQMDYTLLEYQTSNTVKATYFNEPPEMKLSRLSRLTNGELKNEGLLGYALCYFNGTVWEVKTVRYVSPAIGGELQSYVRKTLNKNYSLSARRGEHK